MALSQRGYRVKLVDKQPDCMLRASLRNEGKIHLGFVYANDPSLRTSELMLEASLAFGPLLERFLGGRIEWSSLLSAPFFYLVMADSAVAADKLFDHYEKIQDSYARSGEKSYVGESPERLWRAVEVPNFVRDSLVSAAVETRERAVKLERLRALVRTALEETELIELLYGHRVRELSRRQAGFEVGGTKAGAEVSGPKAGAERWSVRSDIVVNCLWEGRLAIDEQLGLAPARRWVHRLKFRLLGHLPRALQDMPAVTFVHGPFGDVVPNESGSYLSWYPACLKGWSTAKTPPDEWEEACNGEVASPLQEQVASQVAEALDAILPGMRELEPISVDAGVVFAWGDTDIDDPSSGFHERFQVGVSEADGYFSIDTGKLTCAPLFAQELERQL